MLNPSVFGIENISDSLSSFFKIKTIVHTFELDFIPTNIIKLSISKKASYINHFSSLNKNFTTVLIDIDLRVDYLNDDNEFFYKKENIKDIINICTGDYIIESDCIIGIFILDSDIINTTNNKISCYVTFYTFLDT